jgi:hypothetical protein
MKAVAKVDTDPMANEDKMRTCNGIVSAFAFSWAIEPMSDSGSDFKFAVCGGKEFDVHTVIFEWRV